MDILTLELFMAVADYSNFSIAAAEQNISQSSLSKAIIRLENELGVKLFDRKNHPVKLTPAGEQLHKEMKVILPDFRNAIQHTRAFSAVKKISCCVVPTPTIFDLSEYFNVFLKQNYNISLTVLKKSDLLSAVYLLQNGEVDFVIAHQPVFEMEHLKTTFLHDDLLCAIMPKNHPLAQSKTVRLEELKDEIWYVNIFIQGIVRDICAARNYAPRSIQLPGPNVKRDNVITSVAHGNGITLFFESDISIFKLDNVATSIVEDIPLTPLVLLEAENRKLSESQNLFKQFVIDTLDHI
ncbi:MAG: LysR family transcriptional regulator [Clostridiales bacterium]|jgi:DNA-binding transcriptional LysR family regulator|nr:LysR family transcriptional regulator [Clostridiales bacterium]